VLFNTSPPTPNPTVLVPPPSSPGKVTIVNILVNRFKILSPLINQYLLLVYKKILLLVHLLFFSKAFRRTLLIINNNTPQLINEKGIILFMQEEVKSHCWQLSPLLQQLLFVAMLFFMGYCFLSRRARKKYNAIREDGG
jgi:hypothetical protein